MTRATSPDKRKESSTRLMTLPSGVRSRLRRSRKADTGASFPFPPRRKAHVMASSFLLPFVLLVASMPAPAQAQSPVPDLEKSACSRAPSPAR